MKIPTSIPRDDFYVESINCRSAEAFSIEVLRAEPHLKK